MKFLSFQKNKEKYNEFYNEFGKPIKEGLYQDFENRDILIDLVRFKTTKSDEGLTSFGDYVKNMKKGQDTIYYITGSDKKTLKYSPLLEVYNQKGIEVCLI